MAIRNIREIGDEVLTKKCKEVKEMTPRVKELIEDMLDTMYEANGVGLAASQVGILKRIVVIDVTGEDPYIMINPRIIQSDGEQTGHEGCLSVPGKTGIVTRPNYVKAVALNENMEEYEIEADRAFGKGHLPRTGAFGGPSLCGESRRRADERIRSGRRGRGRRVRKISTFSAAV